jgi:hypothetical protein
MKLRFKGTAPWFNKGSYVDEEFGFRKWCFREEKEVGEVEAHSLLKRFPNLFEIIDTTSIVTEKQVEKMTKDYNDKMQKTFNNKAK